MGRQWLHKNREINANRRARIVTRLVREITVAAKLGVPDPAMNPRLSLAIEAARKQSVANDTIARAIRKGSGQGPDAVDYELVTFEGMAPHNVPVVVECLTDNRNRTTPDIRSLWKDGQFGSKVTYLFDHCGMVEAAHEQAGQDLEAAAIEAGAQDVEPAEGPAEGTGARFFTDRADLDAVAATLRGMGWSVTGAELGYRPKDLVALSDEQRAEVERFLERIDEHDDVHRIHAAL